MNPLINRLNRQLAQIEVSMIRQFDEKVSGIPNMIKLTLGEPDFDTPEHIKAEGQSAIQNNMTHYPPMAGMTDLREAGCYFIKEKYGLDYDAQTEVIITVGVTEAIAASLLSVLNEGDRVLLPEPIYSGYEPLIHLAGGIPTVIDTSDSDFVLTPEKIEAAMAQYSEQIKAVILNYPSNPTGITYQREQVKAIADTLKKYPVFVISDEVYSELTYEGTHVSIAEYLPEQTILLNGLSKSHAMTGWRVGFLFAQAELLREIIKVHQYLVTSTSSISQKAAVRALIEGINDAQVMKQAYQERRDYVYREMTEMGFQIVKPNGAFYVFAKIPDGCLSSSMDFCVDLAEKQQVAMIPGLAFGQSGEGYVRVSYATSMELLEEAMNRLRKYMKNL